MLLFTSGFSQQLPQYSQFHRNQVMSNPGAVGAYDFLDITLGHRHQWLGFNNDVQGNISPRTSYLNIAYKIKPQKVRYNPAARVSTGPVKSPKVSTGKAKHALGLKVITDEYGAFRNNSINGTYAVHIPLTADINLSLGTRVGISNHTFLAEKAQVLSSMTGGPVDQTYENFVAEGFSRMFMDISSGLFLYSERFFLGVTGNQITKDFVSIGSGITNFNPQRHYDLAGGMYFDINEDFTVMPAISLKLMSPSPFAIQSNVQFEYKEWLWFGAGYRHNDAVIVMAGGNLNERFKLGYSFDYSTSRFNNFSSGGHEIVLGFMIR